MSNSPGLVASHRIALQRKEVRAGMCSSHDDGQGRLRTESPSSFSTESASCVSFLDLKEVGIPVFVVCRTVAFGCFVPGVSCYVHSGFAVLLKV
jgi:hypothetical protein